MRLLIALGFAILIALPLALSDAPTPIPYGSKAAAPVPSRPALPGTADSWIDFLRTFAGAISGATAAFAFNLWLQRRTRRIDRISSGNHAMSTLIRQYNAFLNIRRAIREESARLRAEAPHAPSWLLFRPISHFLPKDLEIDLESLAFLFEGPDLHFFRSVHEAQAAYTELIGYLDKLEDAAMRKQRKMEDAGFTDLNAEISFADMEKNIGPILLLELQSIVAEIIRHAEEDGPKFVLASDVLHAALRDRLAPAMFEPPARIVRIVGEAEDTAALNKSKL